MGNRLQVAAATPVFVWRVSLLLGCRAGELGRAGHGRFVVVKWRRYTKSSGRPARRSHKKKEVEKMGEVEECINKTATENEGKG